MNEDKKFGMTIALIVIGLAIFIITLIIVMEPVTDKLERTCEAYGMIYEYRDGQNCLDKNNVLHPIYSECPEPHKRGLCDIRFITKSLGG